MYFQYLSYVTTQSQHDTFKWTHDYLPVKKIFGAFNAWLILHYCTKALKGMSKGVLKESCVKVFLVLLSHIVDFVSCASENLEHRVSRKLCVSILSISLEMLVSVAWWAEWSAYLCYSVWSLFREIYNLFYLRLVLWYLKQAWQHRQKVNVSCHEKEQIVLKQSQTGCP